MKTKTKTISAVIPGLLKSIEKSYPTEAHRIWEIWSTAVGPEVARRAKPLEFKGGTLTIAVEGSSWLAQMTYLAPTIIEAVNNRLSSPLVKKLRAKAGIVPAEIKDAAQAPEFRTGPLSEEEEDLLAQAVEGLTDEELILSVRSAREAALRRIR